MADRRIIVYSTTSVAPEAEGAGEFDAGRRIIVYQTAPEDAPTAEAQADRRIIVYSDEPQDTAPAVADGWLI